MRNLLTVFIVAVLAIYSSADFASDCVAAHNSYRTPLNIAPVTWSATVAASAQQWANHLASMGSLEHSNTNYGENLAYQSGTYTGSTSTSSATTNTNTGTTQPSTGTTNANTGTTQPSTGTTNTNTGTTNTNTGTTKPSTGTTNTNTGTTNNNGNGNQNNQQNSNNVNNGNNGNGNYNNGNYNNGNNGNYNNGNYNNGNYNNGNNGNYNNGNYGGNGNSNNNGNNGNGNFTRNHNHNHRRYLDGTSDIDSLIGLWGAEKKYFTYGVFPNDVSTTGDWSDVGHYTQLVWAASIQIGCGIANGNGNEYLVCQYSPAGNIDGHTPY